MCISEGNTVNQSNEDVLASLMEDAIELMHSDEKKAYLEACRRCPDIVKTESDFSIFLRFEEFDIWKAVKRLLKYWDNRVATYGERAFRSLFDLTGNGALSEFDLRVLETKALVILPNNSDGKATVFCDLSKYGTVLDPLSKMRQDFFGTEMAAWQQRQEGKAVPELDILILRSDLPRYLLNTKNWSSVFGGTTYKVSSLKFMIMSKDQAKKAWFQAIFPTFLKEVTKRAPLGFGRVEIYCDDSEKGMKLKLSATGLPEECLPPSLGGSWSYDSFSVWTRLPIILENTKCRAIVPSQQELADILANGDAQLKDDAVFEDSSNASAEAEMNAFLYSDEINRIPYHDRISWIRAQENQKLVQNESLLYQFYRFHGGVKIKAAEHVFSYWSMREKLFSSKAISNMNQIGAGALDRDDHFNLNSGFVMLLPKDCDGNHVLFYDPSRLPKHVAVPQRRIWFYMLFVAVEQAQKENCRIKILICLDQKEASRNKLILHDVIASFPVDVVSYHLVLHEEGLANESYRRQALSKVCSLFNCPADQVIEHTISSILGDNFLSDELAVYGFEGQNIPSSLGGRWDDDCFLMWQDERIRHEAAHRCEDTLRTEKNWEIVRKKLEKMALSSVRNGNRAKASIALGKRMKNR